MADPTGNNTTPGAVRPITTINSQTSTTTKGGTTTGKTTTYSSSYGAPYTPTVNLPITDTARKRKVAKSASRIFMLRQAELKKYLTRFLISQRYSPVVGDGFLYAEGEIPVMLLAHMDTVHTNALGVILKGGRGGKTWMSPNGIGGDDRAGVYMVTELVKELKCHVLFLEDEETGGVGARKFTKAGIIPQLNHMIEFDRMGSNDAVFYQCENNSYEAFITSFGFTFTYGSFSDISTIAPYLGVAAVNLSSGYFNPHTRYETVNFDIVHYNMERAANLIRQSTTRYPYIRKQYNYDSRYGTRYGSRYGYNYDYSTVYDYDDIPSRNRTYPHTTTAQTTAKSAENPIYTGDAYHGVTDEEDEINKNWRVAIANDTMLTRKMEEYSLLPPYSTYPTDEFILLDKNGNPAAEIAAKKVVEAFHNITPEVSSFEVTFNDAYGMFPGLGLYSEKEQYESLFEMPLSILKSPNYVMLDNGTILDDSEYMFMVDEYNNIYVMDDRICAGADGVLVDGRIMSGNVQQKNVFNKDEATLFMVTDLYSEYASHYEDDKQFMDSYFSDPNNFVVNENDDGIYGDNKDDIDSEVGYDGVSDAWND